MNEERMNALERYHSYRKLLMLPTFDTAEEAEQGMPIKEGEIQRFILRGSEPLSSYTVCRAYLGRERGQDPSWAYGEEFTFLHVDIFHTKHQAALLVGTIFIECVE